MPPSSPLNATRIIAAICVLIGCVIIWRTFVAPPPPIEALNPTTRVTLVLPPLRLTDPPAQVAAPTTTAPSIPTLTDPSYPPPDTVATPVPPSSLPTITPQVAAAPPPTSAPVTAAPTMALVNPQPTTTSAPANTQPTATSAPANTQPTATSAPANTQPTATSAPAAAAPTATSNVPPRYPPPVPDTAVPIPTTTDGTIEITFRVFGSASNVAVYYYVDEEETILNQPALPWSLVVTVPIGTVLEVVGENFGQSGEISCAIELTVQGAPIDTDTTTEPEGIAECLAVIE